MKMRVYYLLSVIYVFLFAIGCFDKLSSQTIVYQNLFSTATFDARGIDTLKPTGSIMGSSSVANGIATYSIPIPMPPSTNGIVPELSINYGSNGGYGQLLKMDMLVGQKMVLREYR